MPYLPIEFTDKLRGSTEIKVAGIPYFTGWKRPDPNVAGYVGQWAVWDKNERPKTFIAVNLPGMEVGRGKEGEILTVGEERVYEDAPEHVINSMLTAGYQKLREEMER